MEVLMTMWGKDEFDARAYLGAKRIAPTSSMCTYLISEAIRRHTRMYGTKSYPRLDKRIECLDVVYEVHFKMVQAGKIIKFSRKKAKLSV